MLEVLINQVLSTESGRIFAHYSVGVSLGFFANRSFKTTEIKYDSNSRRYMFGAVLVGGFVAEVFELFQNPEKVLTVASQYDVLTTLSGAGASAFIKDKETLSNIEMKISFLKYNITEYIDDLFKKNNEEELPYFKPKQRVRKQRVVLDSFDPVVT